MTDSIDTFFSEWGPSMSTGSIPMPPEDAQYIYRFARVNRILADRLDATCRRHDLTRSQFEALAMMRRRYPAPLSAGDLMQAAMLSSGSVTAMLGQLLTMGLVKKQTHKEDRRRLEVQLTLEGRKRIEQAIAERVQDNIALAHLLPKDSRRQINQLMRAFLAAAEALENVTP